MEVISTMDGVYRCCAGLDVHKQTLECAVRRLTQGGTVQVEIRQFGTMTDDLLEMVKWLTAQGVTHVAMESTGVFWKPIYNPAKIRRPLASTCRNDCFCLLAGGPGDCSRILLPVNLVE